MKKIFFLTGTRAEFGKLKPLMRYVERSQDLELHVLVTGMHMLKRYGSTYKEVKKESFQNLYMISNQHIDEPMCSIFGNTVSLISRLVHELSPDLIVVHGDRLEAMAGASVGALSNTLVCHIEGGELSGTVDDLIRHSVSKLAHIHMVANDQAKQRLIQMGEGEESVYVIGSPDLDAMIAPDLPEISAVKQHYGIGFDKYAVAMFHPVTSEVNSMRQYARNFFEALRNSGKNYIVIYPNNDLGSSDILAELESMLGSPRFAIFPSLGFERFLVLLKNAEFMIGNSSAGIREAPFYGVPSVNVGTRQSRRHFSAGIVNCGYGKDEVLAAIQEIEQVPRIPGDVTFGDGGSVKHFADALASEAFWSTSFQKEFRDR
ncbi:UDP-N-acetylglucosamine 2-epimerase [Bordetella trematum]|uniref:UDP-N-acetylglucosamine 2-epimerase n=1 Tax=Bordetella trematum TaxID=123899 RepID=UPI0007945B0B|nr:UDP-N-acetylglucosamine 2-epimerase [Bordetella trematum]SAI28636.1 UDP-N-acetylglucosamine 2-epimerase [Bordetella trematum]